ncbi:MAG: metallophosphoesterase [Dehalococcoidia bacterium]|nr:metallophosphoesterase [Dehalococcoidia bacterium]
MARSLALVLLALAFAFLGLSACGEASVAPRVPPPSATAAVVPAHTPTAAPSPTPAETPAVLLAVGDIGDCASTADEAVAALAASLPGTLALVGDLAYETGSAADFARCFDPAWGALRDRVRPAAGNHDYGIPGARDYFAYFGPAAGEPGAGFYSYDLGAWHVVVLNSNCDLVPGGCDEDSPQVRWLEADLDAHPGVCVLAYWHHPRFTSGLHGDTTAMQPAWAALARHHAALVVSGHDHHYERFAPLDAAGQPDPAGVRQFIAGTGGAQLYPILWIHPGSAVRDVNTHGLLDLSLFPGRYAWRFLPVASGTFQDAGSATCP